jgi:hypothetical protein
MRHRYITETFITNKYLDMGIRRHEYIQRVIPLKVKQLKEILLTKGWDKSKVITITKNNLIIDGKHRWTALNEIYKESGKTFMVTFRRQLNWV